MEQKNNKEFGDNSMLVRLANKIRAFFGHPIYLVGSGLEKDNPRDYDLVVILPDSEFINRYAYDREAIVSDEHLKKEIENFSFSVNEGLNCGDVFWRWSDECVKKSLYGTKYARKYIDFKVYPKSHDDLYFEGKPKLKLDTRP